MLDNITLLQGSNYDPKLATKICADGWNGGPDAFYDIAYGENNRRILFNFIIDCATYNKNSKLFFFRISLT